MVSTCIEGDHNQRDDRTNAMMAVMTGVEQRQEAFRGAVEGKIRQSDKGKVHFRDARNVTSSLYS
jgi:hypothetical protein